MRALITGGAGFIGSHLGEALLAAGHRVVAFDDLSTGSIANIASILDRDEFTFVQGSVLDRPLVAKLVGKSDLVFHLAASVGVQLIVDRPLECYRNNVLGTEIVLDAALAHDARVLVTSTSEIYGKNNADALTEEDDRVLGSPLKSRWSYASAKAVDELYAHCYWKSYGLRGVIVRLFNTVGPRQTGRYGMVVPRFVDQALRGEPLTVYGDGAQTRCFCYVGDIVPALVALVQHEEAYGRAFNLGGTEETSIENLARLVNRITMSQAGIRYVPYEQAYGEGFEDMQRRVPDAALARELVGFRPRASLEQIIEMVVAEHPPRARLDWAQPA